MFKNMEKEQKKINWFIGHMKKTVDVISEKKKNIDFVLEIVDSRLPNSSSNSELISIFSNKPIIKIALKSDLIDEKNKDKNLFYASIKNSKDKNRIVNYINSCLEPKKQSFLKKGLKNPIFVGMVVGLPNIGKSSLINFLFNKKVLNVENRPGVTRKSENIKISDSLYLIDTPGVFFKNVKTYEIGLNLALINCVNRNLVNKKDLVIHLFDKILKNNQSFIFKKYFDIGYLNLSADEILISILEKNKTSKNNEETFFDFILKKIIDDQEIKIYLD
ncbi:MAG: ribosome biogenesis GTPase YlqF [Malacoplasma sp.]|nr:ribosome biogenesis GTPase YlqF [Malacoplasma sp.]